MRRIGLGWWHGRRTKVSRRVVGVLMTVGVLALIVALASLVLDKDNDSPPDGDLGPAPTYTGTDFIPESQAQNVAAAMEAFMAYIQVSDEVAQDHFRGWEEKIRPLTGGDVEDWHSDYSPQAQAKGYRQVGERVVESVRLKEGGYVVSKNGNGMAIVRLGACVDSSGLEVVAPGSQDDGIPPGRYSVSVEVVHWPEKDDWGQLVPGKPGRWLVDTYYVDGSGDYDDDIRSSGTLDRALSCVGRESDEIGD